MRTEKPKCAFNKCPNNPIDHPRSDNTNTCAKHWNALYIPPISPVWVATMDENGE